MDEQVQWLVEALGERARRGELMDFLRQGEGCRWCAHPVRLTGHLRAIERDSGRAVVVSTSAGRPDGVVLKPCGNRRASVCPSCSSLYRSDARHLVRAGLTGEKGVGEQVVGAPAVFLTLTAPSFGAVHGVRGGNGVCRAGDPRARCPHGRSQNCFAHHRADDEIVGSAVCSDCYDYGGAVLHNAATPELWRRFTIYLPRALASVLGVTQSAAKRHVRLSTCRVAEFQRRGVVHLHAIIRADVLEYGGCLRNDLLVPQLAVACRIAGGAVSVPHARGRAHFGSQIDVQILDADAARGRKVAAYVAKYASKSAHESGVLDRRIRQAAELDLRPIPTHLRRMVETAWALGGEESMVELREHAHTLGYGGLFLSKSSGYSTTFTALRAARTAWRRHQLQERLGIAVVGYESKWRATGAGWSSEGESRYASQAAVALEEARRLAWEASHNKADGPR